MFGVWLEVVWIDGNMECVFELGEVDFVIGYVFWFGGGIY